VRDVAAVLNPWKDLPDAPDFVLHVDAADIRRHNNSYPDRFRFRLDLLPEPFLGPTDAPVVLLNLNPGYAASDHTDYAPADRATMMRDSLNHRLPDGDAFYYLTDTFADTGGWRWWRKKLNPLIREAGVDAVRRGVQVLEYVGYKSPKFRNLPVWLPSQHYTFHLVRQAVARDAAIVVMRKWNAWVNAVPELSAANIHRLNSPQNVTIGPGNCPTGYKNVLRRIILQTNQPPRSRGGLHAD